MPIVVGDLGTVPTDLEMKLKALEIKWTIGAI